MFCTAMSPVWHVFEVNSEDGLRLAPRLSVGLPD